MHACFITYISRTRRHTPQKFFVLRNAYSNGIATVQERDYLARFHAHKAFLRSVPVPCLEHVGWVEPSFLSQGNSSNDPRDINGCLVVFRLSWRAFCVEAEVLLGTEAALHGS